MSFLFFPERPDVLPRFEGRPDVESGHPGRAFVDRKRHRLDAGHSREGLAVDVLARFGV